jgi:ubiquinone/menaquinone biosynthesis C-methylase UbiE
MSREYFNSRADVWDEELAEKDRAKLEQLAESLEIAAGSAILDVGTGTGVLLPFLLEKIGDTGWLVALDFAEEMLEKARAKNFKGNIDYINADIADVPLLDGIFDAVVCYSSFPHFRNKPKALREINRLLKNGGKLYICHTSGKDEINRIHRQVAVLAHHTIPEASVMCDLLSAAGFVNIDIVETADSYFTSARKSQ